MAQGYTKHTGSATITIQNALINGGAVTTFDNFKLEETYVDATPAMDNAKFIPLANGSYIMIANSVKGGTVKFAAVRTSGDSTNDIVAYATALIDAQTSVGSIITITVQTALTITTTTFYDCFPNKPIPIKVAGNDEPTCETEFMYGSWA